MLFRHALPCAWITVLECEIFGVRTVAENDRKFSVFHRAKNIGAQHETVVHRDRHVPVDPHAVADLGSLLKRRHHALPRQLLRGGQATEGEARRKSEEGAIVIRSSPYGATANACAA